MKPAHESKKMKLVDLNISQENLFNLSELQEEVSSIARHDIGNSISAIRAELQLLEIQLEISSGKISSDNSKTNLEYVDSIIKQMKKQSEQAISKLNILFPSSPDKLQLLISKPLSIFDEVCSIWQDAKIILDKKTNRTLEIVYPERVLGAVINELITNSVKHNPQSNCEITVSWRIHDARFKCEIHDNGIGIIPGLTKTALTAGNILESIRYEHDQPNGLSIINRIVRKSGGSLLYSKSQRLGGTLAYFNFPIFAYYLKGHIYESN